MKTSHRTALLGSATLALGFTMVAAQPAQADSVCSPSFPTTTCTGPTGSVTVANFGGASIGTPGATSLLQFNGDIGQATTSGNIESTTAGRGVLNFTVAPAGGLFTYVGTGSLLDTTAAATGATVLSITEIGRAHV